MSDKRPIQLQEKCPACELLIELYSQTGQEPRDYWVMTELFVMLHDGDVCDFQETGKVRHETTPRP